MFARTVIGRKRVALSSLSNEWFLPNYENCFGSNPILCNVQAVTLSEICEQSLLLGEATNCKLNVSKVPESDIRVFDTQNDAHEIVLASFKPVDLILKCRDQIPKIISVSGLYRLNLDLGCSLYDSEQTFRIDSILTMEKKFHFQLFEEVKVPDLKIDNWPGANELLQLPRFEKQDSIELEFSELPTLRTPKFAKFFKNETNIFYVVISAVTLTFLLTLLGFCLIKIYGVNSMKNACGKCLCYVCNLKKDGVIEPTLSPSDNNPFEVPTNLAQAGKSHPVHSKMAVAKLGQGGPERDYLKGAPLGGMYPMQDLASINESH